MMSLCTRIRRDGDEIEVLDISLVDPSHWEEPQDHCIMHLEGWVVREERTR